MPARDPLATLRRLRSVQVLAARREVADRLAAAREAGEAEARTRLALASEATASAGAPTDYAAWLPAGRAAQAQSMAALTEASQEADVARAALAAARAAEDATQALIARRRREEERAALRRQQQRLDDLVAGRRGRGG